MVSLAREFCVIAHLIYAGKTLKYCCDTSLSCNIAFYSVESILKEEDCLQLISLELTELLIYLLVMERLLIILL